MKKVYPKCHRKAFTLIEEVMIIVIIGVLAMVFAVYIREGTAAWQFLSTQKNLALSSRAALNRINRELKRVNQNFNITIYSSSEISFIDIDNNVVDFRQSGSQLLRGSQVLLNNLQSPNGLTFQYFNSSGDITADPSQMRVVRCRLAVVDRGNKFALESAAGIRVRRLK
ncbi:hypothetical protein HZB07_04640 [Candidatus Saganbacteria bacterium]|nr:hypothetical protein [Candidatus Saganbacteria bacterium]